MPPQGYTAIQLGEPSLRLLNQAAGAKRALQPGNLDFEAPDLRRPIGWRCGT